MGTKNDPGKFDCYASAAPDEPLFTLLARDNLAPGLVRLWAQIRESDVYGAIGTFNQLVQNAPFTTASEKAAEARACADDMETWRDNAYQTRDT